ncbi:TIGR02646 family protein [Halomonas caseinilytica]|uniref:TIGR02646 family protein n=1 Tax=Halomonas caseinilytica TaxID=438744 RepID=A0A1M6MJZ1_9GAMM|nr:TIGR02646 family protein [Halomonas caseinilytica]
MIDLNKSASIDASLEKSLDDIVPDQRATAWGGNNKNVKKFKKVVMEHGLIEQGGRCVWCTLGVGVHSRRTPHRDHIAPKALYSQWTFEVCNIAISCEYCNGFAVKSDLDTVCNTSRDYREVEWLIVHPYFDNTNEHIRFCGEAESGEVVIKSLTERGKWTIEKLKLDDPGLTVERAKEKIFEGVLAKLPDDRKEQLLQALGRR